MDRKISRPAADVIETKPITLAGVETHPGWHALRTLARRITTPLLPDDYLRLANPLWSARELRGRVLDVRRETHDSATLVLKPGLVIHSIYNGYWFWGRPSITDLWHDLRSVTSERPDWDLSAPGLREAWNADDRSPFHGWNKGAKTPPVGSK